MSMYWFVIGEAVLWGATIFLARLMYMKSLKGGRLSVLEKAYLFVVFCGSVANLLAPLFVGLYADLDDGNRKCLCFYLSAGLCSRGALFVMGYESGVIV